MSEFSKNIFEKFDSSDFEERFNVLFEGYSDYSLRIRAICYSTIKNQKLYLMRFFLWIRKKNINILNITSSDLQSFSLDYYHNHGKGSSKWMLFSLRSFFKFLKFKDLFPHDLSLCIPTVRIPRPNVLGDVIDKKQVEKILNCIDLSEKKGIRDHCILLMLATYGIRGIQLRNLKIEDIYWNDDKIHFKAVKSGKDIVAPLTVDVGNSLVDYLMNARLNSVKYREVFLTLRTNHPLLHSSDLSAIVSRRIKNANIVLPESIKNKGSHLFRNYFGTEMVKKKIPHKTISDMLGHKDPNTVMLYLNMDFELLKETSLQWPDFQRPDCDKEVKL